MSDIWFFERLPLRPSPYRGECLSGYLLRLADLNGYTLFWDMISDLFPMWKKPQQIGLLKWEYPLDSWGRIPLRTGLDPDELAQLTTAAWVRKFRVPPVINRLKYRAPGDILHGTVNPVLRICPLCLQSEPYIRLLWRLLPVTTCFEHGCFLQEKCSGCGTLLTPVSQKHRHMKCPVCGADFRFLAVTDAPKDVLDIQRGRQDDFQFLLDPASSLVQSGGCVGDDPYYALGLKFRYIRDHMAIKTKPMAQKVNLSVETITAIERGALTPLCHYLKYLEALHLSWKEFASLEVPNEFVQAKQTHRHMHLRLCPNANCPKHFSHPSTNVHLLKDIPELKCARFRCTTCGKNFTRSYDGSLRIQARLPRPLVRKPHILIKPQSEIASLIEMGMRGESNRKIAHHLGWEICTVRIYWIDLGIEAQVHQAQAKRRAAEKHERYATLRSRIQAALDTLLTQDREISSHEVGQALGKKGEYWHMCCDQTDVVHEVLRQHNARVRRQKDEAVCTQIEQSLEVLRCGSRIMKVEEIAQQAGISYKQLRVHYPELHRKIHETLEDVSKHLKEETLENRIKQIDAAATRLVAQGHPLNYGVILEAAGLSPHADSSIPIRDALMKWVNNFAPRD